MWGIIISPGKTKMQYFSHKNDRSPILIINIMVIEYKKNKKLVGIVFDSPRLKFKEHTNYIINDYIKRINILKAVSSTYWGANTMCLKIFMWPILEVRSCMALKYMVQQVTN